MNIRNNVGLCMGVLLSDMPCAYVYIFFACNMQRFWHRSELSCFYLVTESFVASRLDRLKASCCSYWP